MFSMPYACDRLSGPTLNPILMLRTFRTSLVRTYPIRTYLVAAINRFPISKLIHSADPVECSSPAMCNIWTLRYLGVLSSRALLGPDYCKEVLDKVRSDLTPVPTVSVLRDTT